MDSQKGEDVLLEDVAQTKDQNQEPSEIGGMARQRYNTRYELKRILAFIQVAGDAIWNDQ